MANEKGKGRRYKLSHLLLDEISLVDAPANPGAQILLFKRSDPAAASGKPKGNPDMSIIETVKSHLAGLGVADDQIEKAAKELVEEIGEVKTPEEVEKAITAALKAKADELDKAFEKKVEAEVTKRLEEDKKDDLTKAKEAMTPEARERFEKMEAEANATKERLEKLEGERRRDDLRKRLEPFATIAKTDELLPIFECLSEDNAKSFEAILEKTVEQLSKADTILTKSIGTKEPVDGSAEAELRRIGNEIAKAENLSPQQGFRRAAEKHPDLLRKHREEQRAN
jgi:hypothetical protein